MPKKVEILVRHPDGREIRSNGLVVTVDIPQDTSDKLGEIANAESTWKALRTALSGWDWVVFPFWVIGFAATSSWRRVRRWARRRRARG